MLDLPTNLLSFWMREAIPIVNSCMRQSLSLHALLYFHSLTTFAGRRRSKNVGDGLVETLLQLPILTFCCPYSCSNAEIAVIKHGFRFWVFKLCCLSVRSTWRDYRIFESRVIRFRNGYMLFIKHGMCIKTHEWEDVLTFQRSCLV